LAGGDEEGSGALAAAGAGNWGLGRDSGPFWPQPTRIIAINGASRQPKVRILFMEEKYDRN